MLRNDSMCADGKANALRSARIDRDVTPVLNLIRTRNICGYAIESIRGKYVRHVGPNSVKQKAADRDRDFTTEWFQPIVFHKELSSA